MRRKYYFIILIISALLFISFLIIGLLKVDNELLNKRINLLLTSISAFATIFTLVFAYMPKSKFNGLIQCWNSMPPLYFASGNHHIEYFKITFRIFNSKGIPLNNLQIAFRVPNHLVHPHYSYKEQGLSMRVIKDTTIYSLSEPIFLGSSYGDDTYLVEHFLCLKDWKKGNIYISLSADEIETTTCSLKINRKEELITSNTGNYLNII